MAAEQSVTIMSPDEIERLLAAEESETLERKEGFDAKDVGKALTAFANDLYGHGVGWLILGQATDKTIVGLTGDPDKIQRDITDIGRVQCSPAIAVSVQIYEKGGKQLAVVEVRASPARPHFTGISWVRMGSTTRRANDAEIILLRGIAENRKVALLKRWMDEGRTQVFLRQLPAPGERLDRSPFLERVELIDVNENWIVVRYGGRSQAYPLDEINLGFDPTNDLPEIRWRGVR